MLSIIFRHHHAKRISLKGLAVHADTEGRAEVLDFGIAQAIHTGVLKHPRDAAAPFFDDVHILERRADSDIPHTGIAFDQLLYGQIRVQPAGRRNLQSIIINRHLDGAGGTDKTGGIQR